MSLTNGLIVIVCIQYIFINGNCNALTNNNDNSDIKSEDVEYAATYGLNALKLLEDTERKLYEQGLYLRIGEPAYKNALFNSGNGLNENLMNQLFHYGYASNQATKSLINRFQGISKDLKGSLNHSDIKTNKIRSFWRKTILSRQCRQILNSISCSKAAEKYRTADGSCNNLINNRLGAAPGPQQRFLVPHYDDNVQSPRRLSISNSPLPSPLLISKRIHQNRPKVKVESPSTTVMLMQWGQFVDHDITSTVQFRAQNDSTPRCCSSTHLKHPECFPIVDHLHQECMEFMRSAPFPNDQCDLGFRQQINQVTAYIDASPLYGSSVIQAGNSRLFRNGLIQLENPLSTPQCHAGSLSNGCVFRSGDSRASEQPALSAIHIMLARWHNQIASRLSILNPHWLDEKLYQETRRIVIAVVQHITYREFLPVVLGADVVRLFNLQLKTKGYYEGYNIQIDPSPAASFSASAFRFGHSLVPDTFIRTDKFHKQMSNNVSLHLELSNLENILTANSVDRLILGLVNQPAHQRDEFISPELTRNLFGGLDLAAINIQRGRDHGLPSYTNWREPCSLTPIGNWKELRKIFASKETIEQLQDIYKFVDDIDLYTAGLAERPVRGGLVGPTFACIIAQQFSNLRNGDRFWYENNDPSSAFSLIQLEQIRKMSLAHVICATMPEVLTIQPFVFLTADDFRNQRVACENLQDLDLISWKSINKIENNQFEIEKNKLENQNDLFSLSKFELNKNERFRIKRQTQTTKSPNKKQKINPLNLIVRKVNSTQLHKENINKSNQKAIIINNKSKATQSHRKKNPTEVTRKSNLSKPNYLLHIQVNYFYNLSSTEANFSPNKETHNYNSPNNNIYSIKPHIANDKIDYNPFYDYYMNKYTTTKPPMPVIEINSRPVQSPNVYYINEPSSTTVPTVINSFYSLTPETYVYKRPINSYTTEVNNNHKYYDNQVIYDKNYFSNLYNYGTNQNFELHDKLDLPTNAEYASHMYLQYQQKHTTSLPKVNHVNGQKFVQISTVKGHTTKTNTLNPIFVSIQSKENDKRNLPLEYDDVLDEYVELRSKSADKSGTENIWSLEIPHPMESFYEKK